MPRQLKSCSDNALIIRDNMGGGDITLFYRNPTTAEWAGFTNASVQRRGKHVSLTIGERRQDYGKKILTGFRDGDFLDERGQAISADPESPYYREDWKDLVCRHAADLVQLLAAHVFEGSAEIEAGDEDAADGENAEDAEKN